MTAVEISAISALVGGVLLKVVEAYLLPRTKQADIATTIRNELRGDIAGYKSEVAGYKKEVADLNVLVDKWRSKYFDLIEVLVEHNIDIPKDDKLK